MKFSLDGAWTLRYHPEIKQMPEEALWPVIPAQVPGNVELDLFRAGVEPDPFYAENLYEYRKYEFYSFVFERTFTLPSPLPEGRAVLVFEGLNTYATVYVNGAEVGQADNMLISHEFDISVPARPGENHVKVVIRSAANVARHMDYPVGATTGGERNDDYLFQRKPPHSFGWDIMPRFPSAGMWRGVSVVFQKPTRITQAYYVTRRADERNADILYRYRFTTDADDFDGFSVRVTVGDVVSERVAPFLSGEGYVRIDAPKLWWPLGYGAQPLYDMKMELIYEGEVVDVRTERIGIRTVSIDHTMAAGDAGEFLIKVNGCPILAKGSNWVPLDAMHSRDAERYERALSLFAEAGCNIARCWGGNVYEDHRFYELCDEYGILVWQDFTMACAIYPQTREFLDAIEREATHVIRKLRNHPCILLWAGDNEVDEAYDGHGYITESNRYNAATREALPRAVRQNDPYRMYLPSSPYIDFGVPRYEVPEQHNWGARAYFKDDFYKHTRAHFISECGYHGCPAPESLAKFIPQDKLWPYDNSVWDTHNTEYLPKGARGYNRNQLMADQVRIFFGDVPDTLEAFSLYSQVVQAEAKKFFIERTRIKKWRRTGIIWWNMLDGWPQISDAVVDYYFTKKRAFSYIKRVQQPVVIMLDELSDWGHAVVLGNDSRASHDVEYRLTDADTGEVLLQGSAHSPANENVSLGAIRVLAGEQRLILIEWTVDGVRGFNHYITGFPHFDAARVKAWLAMIDREGK
ncbi:MAG: glycoside hydrolase family 2 protein [Christensenellales bacterium]|jgi:beta-mannosidase